MAERMLFSQLNSLQKQVVSEHNRTKEKRAKDHLPHGLLKITVASYNSEIFTRQFSICHSISSLPVRYSRHINMALRDLSISRKATTSGGSSALSGLSSTGIRLTQALKQIGRNGVTSSWLLPTLSIHDQRKIFLEQ